MFFLHKGGQSTFAHRWHNYSWIHSWCSREHYALPLYGTANRSCTEQQDFWTGWGWTAVVNKVLSSTTLLSSRKHFGSPKLSPLMSDLTTMSLKNPMNKDMLHWSVKPISCINKSPVAILMCGPVLQRCQVAKHWRKPSRAACLDLACLHAGMKS